MVDYAGSFSHEVLWKKFQEECDASLLVYAFDHADDDLYRTHFPTKLSEYAWQGMPMVMVGPAHATGILWGLDHPEACRVVTQADQEPLQKTQEQMMHQYWDCRCSRLRNLRRRRLGLGGLESWFVLLSYSFPCPLPCPCPLLSQVAAWLQMHPLVSEVA
jgi:hypothetical protein